MSAKTWGWKCTCGGGLPIPVVPFSSLEKADARITSLEAQLEKAEKVIGYYAEENTWISKNLDKEGSLVAWSKKTPNDSSIFPYSIGSSNGNFNCLGRRSREYFAEKEQK